MYFLLILCVVISNLYVKNTKLLVKIGELN